jgi:O-glycosyl hydrolase
MDGKGFLPYAIKLQNEPQNSQSSYPTMLLPVSQEAAVGVALRTLLDSNGFSSVKIIGFDHNWNNAATYPVQLMQQAEWAFTGAAFHCYEGSVGQQLDVSLRGATLETCTNSPVSLVL